MHIPIAGILFFILIFGSGCGEPLPTGEALPVITVSILPQRYFVRRIAGEKFRVMVLTGPGQNPHSYEPTPRQMADLSRSRAWILSGAEFEISLLPKIRSLFPKLPVIDGTEGVHFRSLEEHEDHLHGDELEVAGGLDRHTWLGREGAALMSGHILNTLIALDPGRQDYYRRNYGELIADIEDLFAELRGELAPLRGTRVFVYHPAFGYFLDEFGITQEAVEAGGREPTPRTLALLIREAKAEKPRAIFVQAQFPAAAARAAAKAAGTELIPLDPLAPDWLENIRNMGKALVHGSR